MSVSLVSRQWQLNEAGKPGNENLCVCVCARVHVYIRVCVCNGVSPPSYRLPDELPCPLQRHGRTDLSSAPWTRYAPASLATGCVRQLVLATMTLIVHV